ncbi:MAG: GAF domain-containing protein [Halobaculum sp.]
MTRSPDRIQVLYEISLSIGRGDGLHTTARNALSAYLRKLDCSAGGVFQREADGYDRVAAVPTRPTVNDGYRAATDRLTRVDPENASFPISVTVEGDTHAHLLDLPGFGVLVLVKNGDDVPADTLSALGALNEKLADACRAERTERQLREQRNRFETVIETIPEPLVDVVVAESPEIRSANSAFRDQFLSNGTDPTGMPLEDVFDESATRAWLADDETMKTERSYETTDGHRTFSLRTTSIETERDHEERFGLYIDVTERQRREQTLEQLYHAAQDFLAASDSRAVCRRAVTAATEVLEYSACGVHQYDRTDESLIPVVTVGADDVLDGTPDPYTDRETVIWETYRSNETTLIDDTVTFDGRLPDPETDARSVLVLPLGDHGVMIASAESPNAFDESDRYFGQLLATMLRTALDRTERERTLEAVQRTTRSLLTAETVEDACQLLVDQVPEAFGFPYFSVWRFNRAESELRPVATSDATNSVLDEVPSFGLGDSIAWEVYESGEPRIVENIDDEPNSYNADSVLGSELIVPIGEFGVIAAGSMLNRDVTRNEFEVLQTLATGVESAIQIIDQRAELDVLDQVPARVLRHNIRNDLNVIRGRAELVTKTGGRECIEHAERILQMSDELLTTATHAKEIRDVIDRRDDRRTLDVSNCVEKAVASVRSEHQAAEITLDATTNTEATVHPDFERAVRHAVENAVEHGDGTQRPVTVGVSQADERIRVTVDDKGPGISENELAPIRNGEETELRHGSGVGLWIIDRIIEYSGGVVNYETSEAGTTVRIDLDQTIR